jgi:hypothetical protein
LQITVEQINDFASEVDAVFGFADGLGKELTQTPCVKKAAFLS